MEEIKLDFGNEAQTLPEKNQTEEGDMSLASLTPQEQKQVLERKRSLQSLQTIH